VLRPNALLTPFDLRPLIAEARRRARRRRVALSLVAVAAATAAGVTFELRCAPPGGPPPPIAASPDQPISLAIAPDGALYIGDRGRNEIVERTPSGGFRVVAGTGKPGLSGDGGPAKRGAVDDPTSLVITPNGTLYFAQPGRYRAPVSTGGMLSTAIREITPAGTIHTIAGLHPNCPPGAVQSMLAQSARFDGAALSLSPSGALAVRTDLCVGATHHPKLGPHLLLTASGRFVADTSSLAPVAGWKAVDCAMGVVGAGFRAFACESGLGHPRELFVARGDGSSVAYPAHRPVGVAVHGSDIVASYDNSLVRVTSSRLIPLLTNGELVRALHTNLIWDIVDPGTDAQGDIYFLASIENPRRTGCQSLILERTTRGTIHRLWASPTSQNTTCF
jgi:hypothetical protein